MNTNLIQLVNKIQRKISWEVKRLQSSPAFAAKYVMDIPWIEDNILYPRYVKSVQKYQDDILPLDSTQTAIVDTLKSEGSCKIPINSLEIANTNKLLVTLNTIQQKLIQPIINQYKKSLPTITLTVKDIINYPEVLYYGLNEKILNIVRAYIGQPIAYDGLEIYWSLVDNREHGARLWHRDLEDRKMLKMCIYLNDVDEDGGPFQILKPDSNSMLSRLSNLQSQGVSDEELRKIDIPLNVNSYTGKAHTVIFADTSQYFHRAKIPIKRPRYAIFFSYISRYPRNPFLCRRCFVSDRQLQKLTEELSPEQKAYLHWDENLPLPVRWIARKSI